MSTAILRALALACALATTEGDEMQGTYERALALVLQHEGGYVNHPADPGGATNMGVTQRVYLAWRRRQGKPPQSVRSITMTEVRAIYREQYWDRVRADELPPGLDYAVFDYAVNSGPGRAARELQRVLGVPADGVIGSVTLAAAGRADAVRVINRLCDRRLGFMRRLRIWKHFGRGWTRRVAGVRAAALGMATTAEAPLP